MLGWSRDRNNSISIYNTQPLNWCAPDSFEANGTKDEYLKISSVFLGSLFEIKLFDGHRVSSWAMNRSVYNTECTFSEHFDENLEGER